MGSWLLPRSGDEAGTTSGNHGGGAVGNRRGVLLSRLSVPGSRNDLCLLGPPGGGPLQPCAIRCCGATCPDRGGVRTPERKQAPRAEQFPGTGEYLGWRIQTVGNSRTACYPNRRWTHFSSLVQGKYLIGARQPPLGSRSAPSLTTAIWRAYMFWTWFHGEGMGLVQLRMGRLTEAQLRTVG